jgi:hypothetical protein
MSYDVQLFRTETKQKEQKYKGEDFFDEVKNLVAFSAEQMAELEERLLAYDFERLRQDKFGTHFECAEFGISALLTASGLYFQTSGDEDAIFEMGLIASEFTDSGEFEKYDPQNEGWEDID